MAVVTNISNDDDTHVKDKEMRMRMMILMAKIRRMRMRMTRLVDLETCINASLDQFLRRLRNNSSVASQNIPERAI